jgi:hypothetical protein
MARHQQQKPRQAEGEGTDAVTEGTDIGGAGEDSAAPKIDAGTGETNQGTEVPLGDTGEVAGDDLVTAHLKQPHEGQRSIASGDPNRPHVFINGKAKVTPAAHAELRAAGLIEERTDDDPPADVAVTAAQAPAAGVATEAAAAAPQGLQTTYGRLPEYADDSPEAIVDFWYRETNIHWRNLPLAEQQAKAKLVEYVRRFTEQAVAQATATKS